MINKFENLKEIPMGIPEKAETIIVEGRLPAVEVKNGLGAEAFNKTNNPLSNKLPETNPFQINTNPFK